MSLHSGLGKRKKATTSSQEALTLLPADMKMVSNIPEEHVVRLVSGLGDVGKDDISQVKEYDSCSDTQMLTFATAMTPPPTKLSEACRVPVILTQTVTKLSYHMENRLQAFKANGGIVSGKINWGKGECEQCK